MRPPPRRCAWRASACSGFDALPLAAQQALRVASAKGKARFEDVGRAISDAERGVLFDAERAARERAASSLVPDALVQRVLGILADYRTTH